MTKDQIDKIKKTDTGQRMVNDIGEDALLELKPEEIKSRQWRQLEKERKEQTIKQKKIERRIDHFERAKRIEGILF
jgi:translation initiation factor 3 subunit A